MPSITLSDLTYEQIQRYAQAVGIPVDQVADNAVLDWMESIGESVICIVKTEKDRVAVDADHEDNDALMLVGSYLSNRYQA